MKDFALDITGWNEKTYDTILLKKRFYYALIVGFFAFLLVPNEALDSFRYYELAHLYDNLDLFEMIGKSVDDNLDFIYYLVFYLLIKFDLPIQLLTGISVGMYLYMSSAIMDTYLRLNAVKISKLYYNLAILLAFFSVSYIVVFTISRNLTGIMLFYVAINHFMLGHKVRGALFVLLSVFTHFGMFMFIFLFGIAFLVQKYGNNEGVRKKLLIGGTLLGLLANYWISYFMNIVALLPFFAQYEIYMKYLNNNLSNAFTAGFGVWDKLLFLTTALVSLFCLLNIRKYNLMLNICMVLYLWLLTAMGFSFMFTQRTLMLFMPFIGIIAIEYINQQKSKSNNFVFILLLGFSLGAFAINVYAYRDLWIFEFP